MRVIQLGRGYGKTVRMIEWLRSTPDSILMVCTLQEQKRLQRSYPDLSDRIKRFDQNDTLLGTPHRTKIGIDNVDMFLVRAFHRRVDIISLNDED